MIPVEKEIVQISTRPKLDPVTGVVMSDAETGKELMERYEEVVIRRSESVYLLPGDFGDHRAPAGTNLDGLAGTAAAAQAQHRSAIGTRLQRHHHRHPTS